MHVRLRHPVAGTIFRAQTVRTVGEYNCFRARSTPATWWVMPSTATAMFFAAASAQGQCGVTAAPSAQSTTSAAGPCPQWHCARSEHRTCSSTVPGSAEAVRAAVPCSQQHRTRSGTVFVVAQYPQRPPCSQRHRVRSGSVPAAALCSQQNGARSCTSPAAAPYLQCPQRCRTRSGFVPAAASRPQRFRARSDNIAAAASGT